MRCFGMAWLACLSWLPGAVAETRLPLSFELNRGQFDPATRFAALARNYELRLTAAGAAFRAACGSAEIQLRGGRPAAIEPLEPLPGMSNYFLGRDRRRWLRRIPNYARVAYRSVYPGIDQIYYGSEGSLEYDFIVAPGARPQDIRLEFRGAHELRLDAGGDLLVGTDCGVFRQHRPLVFQTVDGKRRAVAAGYRLRGKAGVSFEVGAYDTRQPLVIDPVLQFSMFVGGAAIEQTGGLTLDAAGNIYLTGFTSSAFFSATPRASTGAIPPYGSVFLVKLNPAGTAVLFTTYFGGRFNEGGNAVALDAAGNIYVAGTTNSDDLPVTAGAYQPKFAGGFGANDTSITGDAFVAKFNPAGDTLLYATYLGGPGAEQCYDLAVDAAGNAYVAGLTRSVKFPATPDAAMQYGGDDDGFLAKLDPAGANLLYSTFVGGSGSDAVNRVALDGAGNIYLTGISSLQFPTTGGVLQRANAGSGDAFAMKLNSAGKVVFSTLLGGQGVDNGQAIALDAAGNIYLAGSTTSQSFPAPAGSAALANPGTSGVFVAKLDSTGASLAYSRILAGQKHNDLPALAVAADGSVYLASTTDSPDIPVTADAMQPKLKGARNVVVARLNPAGTSFSYVSYVGGQGMDSVTRLRLDAAGNVILAGTTSSMDFPVKGGFGQIYNGGESDTFITKIVFAPPLLSLTAGALNFSYTVDGTAPEPQTVTVGTNSIPAAISIQAGGESWLRVDASAAVTPAALKFSVNGAGLAPGSYSSTVAVVSRDAGNSPQMVRVTLTVSAAPAPVLPVVSVTSVVNAASRVAGPVAPGEIVALAGTGMGPGSAVAIDPGSPAPAVLGGTQVLFDGQSAPLVSVSAREITAIVPASVAGNPSTSVVVTYQGGSSAAVSLPLAEAAPGLYSADTTGKGQGLILNSDATLNSAGNPAHLGDVVTLIGTGGGATDPPGADGSITGDTPGKLALPVAVMFGDVPAANIVNASAVAGDIAGKFRIDVQIPDGAGSGDVPVLVMTGSAGSQAGLTVNIAAPGDGIQ